VLIDIVLLVVGLVVLVWSADQFVLGSSRLATLFKLPPIVIGAVVMGFGTSAPELLVSTLAAVGGDRDLGVGNIIGSNVANLSLVLGVAALVTAMPMQGKVLRREGPLCIAATLVFGAVVIDGEIARWEGAVLVGLLVGVLIYLIRSGRQETLEDVLGDVEVEAITTGREVGRTLIGLVGTVLGAQLVVWGAVDIADSLGVTGGFIGFSLVALGTSLPELVTTVASARRKETELIIGNLFGSNIFNGLAVGGFMGLFGPGAIGDDSLTGFGLIAVVVITVLAFGMGVVGRKVGRVAAAVLLTLYVGVMVVLGFSDGSDDDETAVHAEPSASVPISVESRR
jgi:cation:H+ antiporter